MGRGSARSHNRAEEKLKKGLYNLKRNIEDQIWDYIVPTKNMILPQQKVSQRTKLTIMTNKAQNMFGTFKTLRYLSNKTDTLIKRSDIESSLTRTLSQIDLHEFYKYKNSMVEFKAYSDNP